MLRTKVCRHQSESGFCSMNTQGKCTFAHSLEELSPVVCFYNERCVNERCTRFHPNKGEPLSYYVQKNGFVFAPIAAVAASSSSIPSPPRQPSPVNTKGTKPCHHAVCKMTDCGFAHSIEQLNPIKCSYDGRCINEKCVRFHPGKFETIESYVMKNGFVFPPPPPPVEEIPEHQRIIIRYDPEDYEDVVEIVYEEQEPTEEDMRIDAFCQNGGFVQGWEQFQTAEPSLQELIDAVPDGVKIPSNVYLIPYDKACKVMKEFLSSLYKEPVSEITEMIASL